VATDATTIKMKKEYRRNLKPLTYDLRMFIAVPLCVQLPS